MHMYIVYIHLPTGIPDIPSDFHEVSSTCDTWNCTYVYGLPINSTHLYSLDLIVNGLRKSVPQDKVLFTIQRPRQESGNVSLVARNPCGQSKTPYSLYFHGKNCAYMYVHIL